MPWLIFSLLIGAGIGAALGHFGQCSSGTCPLTSTWWRGALYGAAVGGLFYFASGRSGPSAANQSTPNVKGISEAQFEAEVTQAALPVVVDFYAVWCGPCKRLAPLLDELAGPLTNRVKFAKVNIDEAPALARQFRVEAVPTLLLFRNGKVVDTIVGLPTRDVLKARLESLAGAGAASTDEEHEQQTASVSDAHRNQSGNQPLDGTITRGRRL
jgi:thioredoxin 1